MEALDQLKFDSNGLIPAIVQDAENGEILMVGWMNREALERTLKEGKVCFWSRSRQKYWIKGETSGHFQFVKGVYTDCDQDCLLVKATQVGAACHNGYRSCFYREIRPDGVLEVVAEPVFDPNKVYSK